MSKSAGVDLEYFQRRRGVSGVAELSGDTVHSSFRKFVKGATRAFNALFVASLLIVAFGGHAGSLDFAPAAQAGFEWSYGSVNKSNNHLSASILAGYTPTSYDASGFGSDIRSGFSPLPRLNVIPLLDTKLSTVPNANEFRVAGFSLLPAASSLDATGSKKPVDTWWDRNWGWVALAGVAGAAVVAVAAGSGGGGDANAPKNGNCNITILGGSQSNTSGC